MTHQIFADILSYLVSIGVKARKKGKNYISSCPFEGIGDDRFVIWPDEKGGRYWCRRCHRSGDLIQLLMDHQKITFKEALNLVQKTFSSESNQGVNKKKVLKTESQILDWNLWHQTAKCFQQYAANELKYNRSIIKWLKENRGISKQSAFKAGLGYNPTTQWQVRSKWGLWEKVIDGKSKQLVLPQGLVIPKYRIDNEIVRLRFRVTDSNWDSRYISVPGSKSTPLEVGSLSAKSVLIVESDLDAILLHQEIKNILVIALGSVSYKLTNRQLSLLSGKNVYISMDNEEPGKKAAARMKSKYPAFHLLPIIEGKDHTEAMLNGLDLKEWFIEGKKLVLNRLN